MYIIFKILSSLLCCVMWMDDNRNYYYLIIDRYCIKKLCIMENKDTSLI